MARHHIAHILSLAELGTNGIARHADVPERPSTPQGVRMFLESGCAADEALTIYGAGWGGATFNLGLKV